MVDTPVEYRIELTTHICGHAQCCTKLDIDPVVVECHAMLLATRQVVVTSLCEFHNVTHTNVIVDGSSPLPRSMTTAGSKCQPLFILRMGRESGRFGVVSGAQSFCQQLTANAYPRLRFGTISGPGAVFLAPNSALEIWAVAHLQRVEGRTVWRVGWLLNSPS
jgi:hypothetical protein